MPSTKSREASADSAESWRRYDPEHDEVPPAPGLPPVSTLHRAHPTAHRGPLYLATALALAYGILTILWVTMR